MTLAQRPSIWKNSFLILISCRTTQLNHIDKYHSDISIKRTMQLTYLRPTLLIEGVPESFNYYECGRVSEVSGVFAS
ncbi:hypothetical protein MTR_5g007175 [Medicago truncatula]|uniref:Uncharacterized protein n=1 Tax=Medicago truncatula TaxID=3880 RepID=A0A072UCQ6_MEDTR|nr:hypothetical protein MTR_5g007175 [Medicago truncatula]